MTKTSFLACLITLLLTACSYQFQRGETYYPNAKYARDNAAAGLRYLHAGDTTEAVQKLQLALQQAPRDPLVIDASAFYFEKMGQINKADQLYVYALSMGTDLRAANQNYGAFLCRNGYYEQSIFYFREAARIKNTREISQAMENCSQKMQHALGDQATWAYYMNINSQ